MNARALLAVGTLLALPAWSQETATFDLKSDSIRNIVRNTAATQYRVVEPVKEPRVERNPFASAVILRSEDTVLETPLPPPTRAEPRVSPLVTSIIDTLLDIDDDEISERAKQTYLALCRQVDIVKDNVHPYSTCPGVDPGH